MNLREFLYMLRALFAARRIQTFLWGSTDHNYGLEEYRRMFRKRWIKLDEINTNNPHWHIEFRKRLLQNAALCIALMALLAGHASSSESNLKQFTDKVC